MHESSSPGRIVEFVRRATARSRPSRTRQPALWNREGLRSLEALIARDRVLFFPHDDAGLRRANYAAGEVLALDSGEKELATAIRRGLSYDPLLIDLDAWRSEQRKAEAERDRRHLMHVFGVRRQRDWLTDARLVSIDLHCDLVLFQPLHNLRRPSMAFEGLPDSLAISARLEADSELAQGLLEANARCS